MIETLLTLYADGNRHAESVKVLILEKLMNCLGSVTHENMENSEIIFDDSIFVFCFGSG
jgi:hypothetical protein